MTTTDRAVRVLRESLDRIWGYDAPDWADDIAADLRDAGLLAPEPQIIRTRDELAALDPDTLVTAELPTREDSPFPHAVAWGASVAYDLDLIWRGPMVVIATGEHVRAARQALKENQ